MKPEDCEYKTIELDVGAGPILRKPAFCHKNLAAVREDDNHWVLIYMPKSMVVNGACFHNIEDACNAMEELDFINEEIPTVEESNRAISILRKHHACMARLLVDFGLMEALLSEAPEVIDDLLTPGKRETLQ